MEYYVDAQRNARARGVTKVYINFKQRKQLIQDAGDAGCVLYGYYLEKSGIKGFQFRDDAAAATLGWKESKVRRIRLVLVKTNWFYQTTYFNKSNTSIRMTYLGKDTVNAIKDDNDPIWADMAKLGKLKDLMEVTTIEEIKANISEAKAIWDTL